MASSCLELKNGGENVDGAYLIGVTGFGPLTVYCDMTTDGGGWTQLYDQDVNVAPGYEPTATWAAGLNVDQPNMGQYSILHLIDAFEGVTPGFEFWFDWPVDGRFIQWEQSDNPFVGRGTVNVIAQSPANQLGADQLGPGCSTPAPPFGGLAADDDGPPTMPAVRATLDGSIDACWWWAVGTSGSAPFAGGGIPTYGNATPASLRVAPRARLWVR
jgi:hypothetical protein